MYQIYAYHAVAYISSQAWTGNIAYYANLVIA